MSRKTLMVAVGAAALVLGMGAGAGAQYPTPTPEPNPCVQVDDAIVTAGQEDQASGDAGCFPGGVEIDGVFASHPVVVFTTTTNANGSYTSPVFRIPQDAEPGDHSLTVTDGTTSYSRTIVVTGAAADGAAGGAGGRLPRTGGQVAFLALWAVALISFGSALIAFTWKRWRAARIEAVLVNESPELPMLEPGSDIHDLRASYGPITDAETTGPVATIAGGALDEPDEVTQTVQREAFSLASVTNGRTPQDVVADLEQQIANWRTKK